MEELKTKDLETLFKLIIKKLNDENVEKISFKSDWYRFISADVWHSFEDKEILTGSIYDDIGSLNKILKSDDPFITCVDFDRIASVLREISEIRNPVGN